MPELHERGNARSLEREGPTAALLPRAASKRMGDDSAMQARWSDAWILAAVDWAADADLAKVIAAADAINHAIPTIEEVEHAIQFLGAAGLVHHSDTSLTLTDEGRRICQRAEDEATLF